MPKQIQVINAVNRALAQHFNIEFRLNEQGICAGLAALFVKYSLEGNLNIFFDQKMRLTRLAKFDHIPSNLLGFITHIERLFNVPFYTRFKKQQSEIEKEIKINQIPVKNEYNLGMVTQAGHWAEIFKHLKQENRSFLILSTNHAIAMHYAHGQFKLYDPNYGVDYNVFDDTDKLVAAIRIAFNYKGSNPKDNLGLSIRAFAQAGEQPATIYPEQHRLLQEAQDLNQGKLPLMIDPEQKLDHESFHCQFFADRAFDTKTMDWLFRNGQNNPDPKFNELISTTVIDHYLASSNPPVSRELLLNALTINIRTTRMSRIRAIATRLREMGCGKEQLSRAVIEGLTRLLNSENEFLSGKDDYSDLTDLIESLRPFRTSIDKDLFRLDIHLHLLTFLQQEKGEADYENYLNQLNLTPPQLVEQIEFSARHNQVSLLNILCKRLTRSGGIDYQNNPFSSVLFLTIRSPSLKLLLGQGFKLPMNESILAACNKRIDRSICKIYCQAYVNQCFPDGLRLSEESSHEHEREGVDPLILLIHLEQADEIQQYLNSHTLTERRLEVGLVHGINLGNSQLSNLFWHQLQIQHPNFSYDELFETLTSIYVNAKMLDSLKIIHQLSRKLKLSLEEQNEVLAMCKRKADFSLLVELYIHATDNLRMTYFKLLLSSFDGRSIHLALRAGRLPVLNLDQDDRFRKLIHNAMPCLEEDDRRILAERISDEQSARLLEKRFDSEYRLSDVLLTYKSIDPDIKDRMFNRLMDRNNRPAIHMMLKHYNPGKDRSISLLYKEIECGKNKLIRDLFAYGHVVPEDIDPNQLQLSLQMAIQDGRGVPLSFFINENHKLSLNYTQLFMAACQFQQYEMANLILKKNQFIHLDQATKTAALEALFVNIPQWEEFILAKGLFRLMHFTLAGTPRESLLRSLQNPMTDPGYQRTKIHWNKVIAKLKDHNNKQLLFKLVDETEFDRDISIESLLKLIEILGFDQVIMAKLMQKVDVNRLYQYAAAQQAWDVVGYLALHQPEGQPDDTNIQMIQSKKSLIINTLLTNARLYMGHLDIRPLIFSLQGHPILNPESPDLKAEIIHTTGLVENRMIENNQNLRGITYSKGSEDIIKQLNEDDSQLVIRAKDQYLKYTSSWLCYFSIFHRHGSIGKKRAIDFAESKPDLNTILTYLSNPAHGNTHSHSFRTYLLHALWNSRNVNEQKTLKEVSLHFQELLGRIKSDHDLSDRGDLTRPGSFSK